MDQILTYPVEMYVARHVLDVSVFQTLLGKGPTSSARHYWITVSIWSLTMLLALTTDDLGAILEIFGAFGASVSAAFALVGRLMSRWLGFLVPALRFCRTCAWRSVPTPPSSP